MQAASSRKHGEFGVVSASFASHKLVVGEIAIAVIDEATKIRARYGFKSPDAIHLATAIAAGASTFLTADAQLTRCREVPVEIM